MTRTLLAERDLAPSIPVPSSPAASSPAVSSPAAFSLNDESRVRRDPPPLFASKVPIAAPSLPPKEEILEALGTLLEGSQLTNGDTVARLEREAARFLGVPECVAVSSCTSGLMLVERCLGLAGEVILPSFTFFATGHSLLWNGLDPVLADSDPGDFNMDPEQVERAITPRTTAILAVHVFGCPAQVKALEEIARRRGLRLIFDGAHAFGSKVNGRGVAQWGDATVFSLSPTKPLVAGEGGLIAVADPELASQLRQARNYGKGAAYNCDILGLNARMTEMQAALALLGLPYLAQNLRARNDLAAIYGRYFRSTAGLTTQAVAPGLSSTHKDFAVLVDPERFGICRNELEDALTADNVEVRRYFDPPLHRQKFHQQCGSASAAGLAVAERLSSQVLCLPLHAGLKSETVEAIAARVVSLARPAARRASATK
jgi:dTDP-4-amino-4,6-dideoxygalactose transaminase